MSLTRIAGKSSHVLIVYGLGGKKLCSGLQTAAYSPHPMTRAPYPCFEGSIEHSMTMAGRFLKDLHFHSSDVLAQLEGAPTPAETIRKRS